MTRLPNPPDLLAFSGRVGAAIRARRLRLKLSVAAAADKAGLPASTWYRYEAGRCLELDRLPIIASALGCRVHALLKEAAAE